MARIVSSSRSEQSVLKCRTPSGVETSRTAYPHRATIFLRASIPAALVRADCPTQDFLLSGQDIAPFDESGLFDGMDLFVVLREMRCDRPGLSESRRRARAHQDCAFGQAQGRVLDGRPSPGIVREVEEPRRPLLSTEARRHSPRGAAGTVKDSVRPNRRRADRPQSSCWVAARLRE